MPVRVLFNGLTRKRVTRKGQHPRKQRHAAQDEHGVKGNLKNGVHTEPPACFTADFSQFTRLPRSV